MYKALYRKYRPKTFDDVVGQDVIVKTFENSIKTHQINHAYMFFGPRGTGKTSVARIIARAINCLDDNNILCESCTNCNVSRETSNVDIIEIDAASNNGVDEIRELRNKVNLVPATLRYKVYIVDEVHMLTTGAFNALLKTLEEPPKHVVFILATTDPQKVPETVVSRCQCFGFKRVDEHNIKGKLLEISKMEQIKIDENVISEIAKASNGGLRDAIGMLDKLSVYSDEQINMETFLDVNDMVETSELEALVSDIYSRNTQELLKKIDSITKRGKNIVQIMRQMQNYLRDSIVSNIKIGEKDVNMGKSLELAQLLNEKMFDIKNADDPKIYTEIMLINHIKSDEIISREIICEEKEEESVKNDIKKELVDKKEESVDKTKSSAEKPVINPKYKKQRIKNIGDIVDVRVNNAFINATKASLKDMEEVFTKIRDKSFDKKIGYLVCELLDGKVRAASDDYAIISYEYESQTEKALEDIQVIENMLTTKCECTKKLALITNVRWNEEKEKYINNKKNDVLYEFVEEPDFEYEDDLESASKDEFLKSFSSIVEVE